MFHQEAGISSTFCLKCIKLTNEFPAKSFSMRSFLMTWIRYRWVGIELEQLKNDWLEGFQSFHTDHSNTKHAAFKSLCNALQCCKQSVAMFNLIKAISCINDLFFTIIWYCFSLSEKSLTSGDPGVSEIKDWLIVWSWVPGYHLPVNHPQHWTPPSDTLMW